MAHHHRMVRAIAACLTMLGALAMSTAPALAWTQVPPGAQEEPAADERFQRRITPEVLVVREASPAVVYIVSSGFQVTYDIFQQEYRQPTSSVGTGVVVDADGFVVTNFHVVANTVPYGGKLEVQFDTSVDESTYEAQLVSYVPSEDLALLKIRTERKFPTITMGTSSDLMIGERVIAIGNPYRQKLSVSAGLISGLHRELAVPSSGLKFTDLIQTDASINHGNSGGPLLNINGELIGINTVVREGAENMGFAIPVDRVRDVLTVELFAPRWERAWLGFELEAEPSLRVARVRAESPAALAGLAVGDTIVAIDGQLLDRRDAATNSSTTPRKTPREEYKHRRLTLLPGVDVALRVRGSEGERELTLRGWSKVDGILFDRLGLTCEVVRVGRGMMLQVARVATDGPASTIGLAPGDVVDAVRPAGTARAWSLSQPEVLARLVVEMAAGTELEIDVLRDENKNRMLEPAELLKGRLTLR